MSAVVTAAVTVVLVLATIYYAWQNRRMAQEMKKARELQVRPHLVPTLRYLGASQGFLRIVNVGPGSALRVDVVLRLEPGTWERRWTGPIVVPGEAHDYRVDDESGEMLDLHTLTQRHTHFHLSGSCEDALGVTHQIEQRVEIREAWRLAQAANEILPQDPHVQAAAALEGIKGALADWRHAEQLKRKLSGPSPPTGA